MGQKKFTDYDAFTEAADGDVLLGVDVSDTTQSGTGTTKKLPVSVLATKIREGTTFKEQSTAAGDFASLADGDKLLGVDVSDSDTAKNLTLSQLAASQAMSTSHVKRVADLAALRALTGMQTNQTVEMVTTGRAGLFRWDDSDLSAEVTADTQMGIYVPPTGQDGSSGAWVRVYSGTVDVRWFGAALDNATDDSTAVQAAADWCAENAAELVSAPGHVCYLAAAVDLRGVERISFLSDIRVSPDIADIPVTVGGFSASGIPAFKFNSVTDGTSVITAVAPARPVFRVFGMSSGVMTIASCNYLQFYADESVPGGTNVAYNKFYLLGGHRKVEIYGEAGISWVNENSFYGGRIKELRIEGVGYSHNHNKFFAPTLEGDTVEVRFVNAHTNQIYGARLEATSSAPGIFFDADSYANTIIRTESTTGSPRSQFDFLTPVEDLGQGNCVTTESLYVFNKTIAFDVSPSSTIIANSTDSCAPSLRVGRGYHQDYTRAALTPHLSGVGVAPFDTLAISDFIPVVAGDSFGFQAEYEGSLLRPAVYVYDENMRPLTDEMGGGVYINAFGMSLSVTDGRGVYRTGTGVTASGLSANAGAVARSEVAFIQLALQSSSSAGIIRSAQAFVYTSPNRRAATEASALSLSSMPSLDGAPTKGYAPFGYGVLDRSATPTKIWHVSYQYESFAVSAVATGGTSIEVTDPESIANGDICGIQLDDGTTHWTTVSGLSGSTFTIDAVPTGKSVEASARVVFNRWTSSAADSSTGTATVTTGNTSVTVAHGLSSAPDAGDINVTATNSLGSATKFWISNITSTNFDINVDVDPAGDATFAWSATA